MNEKEVFKEMMKICFWNLQGIFLALFLAVDVDVFIEAVQQGLFQAF